MSHQVMQGARPRSSGSCSAEWVRQSGRRAWWVRVVRWVRWVPRRQVGLRHCDTDASTGARASAVGPGLESS